ncbi:GH3 domain-containing protein isoform X2 [Pseudophryne corroboree]|uniref:GH3 domain-containing protein isoform X2 n=1 Tax=Pseudophryne corroboree TaxID=495146 RepID=UPI0030813038
MVHFLIITLVLGACATSLLVILWRAERVKRWMAGLKRQWCLKALSNNNHRKNLEHDTKNAQSIQECLLLEALRKHQDTEYGLKNNFKILTDVSSFQRLHPLTQYCDYKDYVRRTSQGEENIMMHGRPFALVATAGTSGNPSMVPISAQRPNDSFQQGTAVYLEIIHSNFPGALEKMTKFTFPPNFRHTEAGIPIINFPFAFSNFLNNLYSSTIPDISPMSHHEILYIQLLFALKEKGLSMLEANFSWFLRYVFSVLEDSWESLVADIQKGRLSSELKIPLDIRKQTEDLLVPDAVRASELRAQFQEGFCGIAKRVWPNLQVIVAVETGGSDLDRQTLKDTLCKGTPLYSPIYCAAEGLCGVNLWPLEDVPQYVLIPRSAFFEFIPMDTNELKQTLSVRDVTAGKAYELVITNRDGLYRYQLGDVVQVTGFHNQSPIVEFVYRKSQTLSVRGERISERHFYRTLMRTVNLWPGASLLNYCCAESGILGSLSGGSDPHYEVFIALKGVRDLSEDQRYKDVVRFPAVRILTDPKGK